MRKIIIDPKCARLPAAIFNGEKYTYILYYLDESLIPEMGKTKLLDALGPHCLNSNDLKKGNGALAATDFPSDDVLIRYLCNKKLL